MSRTVIYTRQSLDGEKQKHSTEMQKVVCLEYALRKKWVVEEHFNEGYKSAQIVEMSDRPALQHLLQAVKEGTVKRLLVYKRDRLARRIHEYLDIYQILKLHQVEVTFVASNEPAMSEGPLGELLELLLAGFAEQEGENIRLRKEDTMRKKARQGYTIGGHVILGYCLVDKKYAPLEKDRSEVLSMFHDVIECFSEGDTASTLLNKMKLRNKNYKSSNLSSRVSNPIYKGVLVQTVAGESYPYPDESLRYVSDEVWELANSCLKKANIISRKGRNSGSTNKPLKRSHPKLLGKTYCGCCNRLMELEKKKYVCFECNIKHSCSIIEEKVRKDIKAKRNKFFRENRLLLMSEVQKKIKKIIKKEQKYLVQEIEKVEKEMTFIWKEHEKSKQFLSKYQHLARLWRGLELTDAQVDTLVNKHTESTLVADNECFVGDNVFIWVDYIKIYSTQLTTYYVGDLVNDAS